MADLKKACKKATDKTWGSNQVPELTKCRDELGDFSTETNLQGVKDKLLEAAAALKAFRKLMPSKAWKKAHKQHREVWPERRPS